MTARLQSRTFAAVAVIALCLAASPLPAVEFQKSIDEARKADSDGKPMVVQFTASWCGWCRKMTFGTFADPKVEAIAKDYLWVEVDIDQQPALAATFRVGSVPHTVVLDKQGRVLGSEGGYFAPEKFVEFLAESLKNPQPEELVGDLVARFSKTEKPEDQKVIIERLVDQLARPSRYDRDEILAALEQKELSTWPILLDLLSDKRLAIRAAAAGALAHSTKAELPFQPFAKSEAREAQVRAWREWVAAHSPEASSAR